MGWMFYQITMAVVLVVAAPFLLLRRGRHYLETLSGRLGGYREADAPGATLVSRPIPVSRPRPVFHPRPVSRPRPRLWIHAVSVGEVGVAATLVQSLPESLPVLVTTVTPTGQRRAREVFAKRTAAGGPTDIAYLPFDFGFALRRFFNRFSPRALVLVEGDYWPLALRFAAQRNLPVAVVNGRVSEKSFGRLRRLGRWSERLFFSPVGRFGVQTEEDRRRLVDLGVPPERVHTTGNLKYDSPEPAPIPELEDAVHRIADGRPVLVAGSTMSGEEEHVLDAFGRIGGGRRALLVLVPRHPERWDGVARLLDEQGWRYVRRSEIPPGDGADVVLLDSLGELAALYRIATAAFIGGTLVPTGGHNPLEPARFAVPIVVGPSMENFREIESQFNEAEAWRQVDGAAGLAAVWQEWLNEAGPAAEVGRRGDELLRSNQGALRRTLEMLDPILSAVSEGEA